MNRRPKAYEAIGLGRGVTAADGAGSSESTGGEPFVCPGVDHPTSLRALSHLFLGWAEDYYRGPDRKPTGEADQLRYALIPLVEAFGDLPGASFSPGRLRVLRDAMAAEGKLARRTINQRVRRIRQFFRWCEARELIPGGTTAALATIEALKAHRSRAKEPPERGAIDRSTVEATVRHMAPTLAAMVWTCWFTAARIGEVCQIRTCDIDRSRDVWIARPANHKSAHWNIDRVLPIGPRLQDLVRPFLDEGRPTEFIFRPERAQQERGRRPRADTRPCYDSASFGLALRRACAAAGVRNWTSHQLRKAAATRAVETDDMETAALLLGHRDPSLTASIYARVDLDRALRFARTHG